ncbi:squalene/phytoene synthase family protein [Amaricoccus sp.]|uniref:squalene/phytoene synthase family protein n=1 Tax=Amaricoccus sp. TaxID=1872485 RepID=UPI001B4F2B9F|nr:squalene/phytoene synthase family protein [Amaricoccus sp.]MBP7241659.1 squalene/phytoene synthase family protein [Amaricoccus sp.]
MSFEVCAALVARGDPERFRAAMVAPAGAARDGLMALYAFNLELARAGWVASEPILGQIRLRWWADALAEIFAGLPPRAHEVCAPLAATIRGSDLPEAPLQAMVAAREWDCDREGFAGHPELVAYLEATGGGLAWLAARHLGAPAAAESVVREAGRASAGAAFLRAAPRLRALGRRPLPEGAATAERLARDGLDWLARARAGRRTIPPAALPALLQASPAGGVLRAALARPALAIEGGLDPSEFALRGKVALAALTGRW